MVEKAPMNIDVVVSQEKLNDFSYVQQKLFETKLKILFQISEASDKNTVDLIREFLPEIQAYNNADSLLEKYSLELSQIFTPASETSSTEENNSKDKNTKKVVLKIKPSGNTQTTKGEENTKKRVIKIKKLGK